MFEPYKSGMDNTCTSQSLELAAIPYSANQSVDPLLWNRNFCPISIFSINKYLDGNTKNIICSLYKMLPPQKLNYLPSDIVSIKPPI